MEERKGLSSSVDKDTSASEDINEKFSKNDPENEPFWSELIQKDSFPQDEGIHKKKEEKEGKEKLPDEAVNQKKKEEKEGKEKLPDEAVNQKKKEEEKGISTQREKEKNEKDEKDNVCLEAIRDLPQSLPEALQRKF